MQRSSTGRGPAGILGAEPSPSLSLEFPEQDTPGVLHLRLVSTSLENWLDVNLMPPLMPWVRGCLPHSRAEDKIIRGKTGLPVLALLPACCEAQAALSGLQYLD